MREGIKYAGIPSAAELETCPGMPSAERRARGPVACIECVEHIPCNPCEAACRFGAIKVGSPITNVPVLDEALCIGCGECITRCPGLAITVLNKACGGGLAELDFPYEYLPLPAPGDSVDAVNREGAVICAAEVVSVSGNGGDAGTKIIRIRLPLDRADEAKSIRRLSREVK